MKDGGKCDSLADLSCMILHREMHAILHPRLPRAMIERRKDRSARYATRISFLRATRRSDKQMREYRGFKQKCFVIIGNRHENIIDEYRDSEAR